MTDKNNNKHDEVSLAEELDYEVDFDDFDGKPLQTVEVPNEDVKVEKTTKDNLRDAQDLMVSIIKKEMAEQAALGTYDTKLMKLLDDILKRHEVGLDDKTLSDVQNAFAAIQKSSKKHTADHKKTAQSNRMN